MMVVSVTRGKTFTGGERVDNDKLNELGLPTVEVTGGLEGTQVKVGAHWYFAAAGSAPNVYEVTLGNTDQDAAALVDGMVVAWKAHQANTGAASLKLIASSGTVIGTAGIRRGAVELTGGEIAVGLILEARYYATGGYWQLVSPLPVVTAAEAKAGAWFWGGTATGTWDVQAITLTPAITALAAGLKVRFVPVGNVEGAITLNVNGLGAVAVKRYAHLSTLKVDLSAYDLRGGMVAECVYDGSEWVLLNGLTPRRTMPAVEGLRIVNDGANPNTQLDITADWVNLGEGSGSEARLVSDVAVTVDMAVSGAGGLDTGSEANSTWYAVYLALNPVSGLVIGLLSTDFDAPTLPGGYTLYQRVGAVFNDGSGNLQALLKVGRRVWLEPVVVFTAKGAAGADAYEALSGAELAAFQGAVPEVAVGVSGTAGSSSSAYSSGMAIAADGSGLGEVVITGHPVLGGAGGGEVEGFWDSAPFEVPLKTQNLYWLCDITDAKNRLVVTGYTDRV